MTLAILEKMKCVMEEVAYIQKDKYNDFHKYYYASEAAIKEKLHDAFVKHGVVFSLSIPSVDHLPLENGKEILTTVKVIWRFFDVASGESLEGCGVGVGLDKGDKGVYKAITGAIKYILTANFLIPTGDDPEDEGKGNKSTATSMVAAALAVTTEAELKAKAAKLPETDKKTLAERMLKSGRYDKAQIQAATGVNLP